MTETDETQTWMSLLRNFNLRLRRLAILGVGLLITVVADWWFQDLIRNQKAEYIEEILNDFAANEQYKNETIQYLTSKNKDLEWAEVELNSFPLLNKAVSQKVQEKFPEREYKLGPFTLTLGLFRFALVWAPVMLLLGSIVTVLQVRRLHIILGPLISSKASVQLALNSPFFDRVTLSYGEKRVRHFLAVTIIHLPIFLSSVLYIPTVIVPVNHTKLFITLFGFDPVTSIRIDPSPELAAMWCLTIIFTTILWLALSFLGTKPWYMVSTNKK